LRHKAFMRVQI